jgi:hypothetical protein
MPSKNRRRSPHYRHAIAGLFGNRTKRSDAVCLLSLSQQLSGCPYCYRQMLCREIGAYVPEPSVLRGNYKVPCGLT